MAWFCITFTTGEPPLETGEERTARACIHVHEPKEIATFTIDGDPIDPQRWAPRPITPERLAEIEAISDAAIDTSDIPEVGPEFFRTARFTPKPACTHPFSARVGGTRSLAAPLGRESDQIICEDCGEELSEWSS